MKRPLMPLAGNMEPIRINWNLSIIYIRAMDVDIQCLHAIVLYYYKYTEKHQLKNHMLLSCPKVHDCS